MGIHRHQKRGTDRTSRLGAAVFVATLLFPLCGWTAAIKPSFDCDQAHGDVENLICSDDELAQLDLKLAKTMATALAKASAVDVSGLKNEERDWRRKRNGCAKASDPRQCTVNAYQNFLGRF